MVRARLVLALGLVTIAGSLQAQTPNQEPPKNLQVLPKDMSREEVIGIMRNFTAALGVRCDACHAGQGQQMDFASDEKENKKIAREMIKMVGEINGKIGGMGRTLDGRARVRCVTCHNGLSKPRTLNAELLNAYDAKGIDSTVALFRALRTRYYGRSSYDFGDPTVGAIAEELASKPERRADALTLLAAQAELAPTSGAPYMFMARIHAAAGDTTKAIDALTKGTQVDPQNRGLQGLLNQLKGRRP